MSQDRTIVPALRRCLREQVEDRLAELILRGEVRRGDHVRACLRGGEIAMEKVDEAVV